MYLYVRDICRQCCRNIHVRSGPYTKYYQFKAIYTNVAYTQSSDPLLCVVAASTAPCMQSMRRNYAYLRTYDVLTPLPAALHVYDQAAIVARCLQVAAACMLRAWFTLTAWSYTISIDGWLCIVHTRIGIVSLLLQRLVRGCVHIEVQIFLHFLWWRRTCILIRRGFVHQPRTTYVLWMMRWDPSYVYVGSTNGDVPLVFPEKGVTSEGFIWGLTRWSGY